MSSENIVQKNNVQEDKVREIKAKGIEVQESMFTVSTSPHVRCEETTSKIMWNVNIALAPAAIFSIFYFGLTALINIAVGLISAVACEYLLQKFLKKKITAFDGSAAITGILLAMSLPPSLPPYMIAIGSFIAIVVAKQSMGGLGFNIFNPAHIGRAALMVSWPVAMTTWTKITTSVDVVTSATPLNILKQQGYDKLVETFGGNFELYKAMFLGTRNGSLGETSTILLLIGGIYLIYKGYINWHVPYDGWRTCNWSFLYGNRYGYYSNYNKRTDNFCCGSWCYNCFNKIKRWLSRRCLLLNFINECCNTINRSFCKAKDVWSKGVMTCQK
jgi:electron transport complex protein RnfD